MILPSRKSIRKKEFNYALPGYYHITMCCYQHQSIFGNVINEKMLLNEYGLIANKIWCEIEMRFSNVHIYALQIMPNHLHVIIQLIDTKIKNYNLLEIDNNQLHEANISNVVGSYKSIVTNRIYQFKNQNQDNQLKFEKLTQSGKIWQRNYYENIIKDDIALKTITNYILENPKRWGKKKIS